MNKDHSFPAPSQPEENWLMKPALEWLEQAEHGGEKERCQMIADLLRDLWRRQAPPSEITATPANPAATPRTDAHKHNMGSVTEPHWVVDAEFAQQLERELAEARERAAESEISFNAASRSREHWMQRAEAAESQLAAARADERERCAKVCDELADTAKQELTPVWPYEESAAAIRALGEAK